MTSLHDLFKKDGFRPRKTAGQNFLVDKKVLDQIEAYVECPPGDVLLEVGGGYGALTERLLRKNRPLLVVENDHKLFAHLEAKFAGQGFLKLLKEDVRKFDLGPFVPPAPARITLVGNIPYYLTTPLITRLLEEEKGRIRSISLMVQREVADRLGARPGTKAWGALSVCARYYADFEMLFPVGAMSFRPAPKVESAFIRLTPRAETPLSCVDEKRLFRLVRAVFQTRRKTLLNSLKSGGWTEEAARAAIGSCELKPDVRGETLALGLLMGLSRSLGLFESQT